MSPISVRVHLRGLAALAFSALLRMVHPANLNTSNALGQPGKSTGVLCQPAQARLRCAALSALMTRSVTKCAELLDRASREDWRNAVRIWLVELVGPSVLIEKFVELVHAA
jgi:hypothetical protein